jgi:hypothetical protein
MRLIGDGLPPRAGETIAPPTRRLLGRVSRLARALTPRSRMFS